MGTDEIKKLALNAGYVNAAKIETSELVFVEEYRKFCEKNDCGNFGKNYACPPSCGTPQEMKEKVLKYNNAFVFQSQSVVKNLYDNAEVAQVKKAHVKRMRDLLPILKESGLPKKGLSIMCGPCTLCKTCAILENKPCVNPEGQASCVSAYCIDASKMAKSCNMNIEWNGDTVSFFSLYVF